MNRAGIVMLAGTDLGLPLVYPGFGLHDELELLVREAGLIPMQALQSATRNPPRFFGLEDEEGTIAPGMAVDLVLLDADPLGRSPEWFWTGAISIGRGWMRYCSTRSERSWALHLWIDPSAPARIDQAEQRNGRRAVSTRADRWHCCGGGGIGASSVLPGHSEPNSAHIAVIGSKG